MTENSRRYSEIKGKAKVLGINIERSNIGFIITRKQEPSGTIGNVGTIEEVYQFLCAYKKGYDDGVSRKEIKLVKPIFSNQITY